MTSHPDAITRSPREFQACFFVFLIAGICLFPSIAAAHKDPNAPVPSVRAFRTDEPIMVDGVLDEPFWSQCDAATNFIDIRTQQPAAQQSVMRVAYTRTHVYIAGECFDDDISQIHATERREDRSFDADDFVEVHFDPTHSHRSKYAFFTNPLGTRYDANEGPSGQFNIGWTAEWELEAKILEDRWVFEMSIPLSVMNYFQADNQTWGLNFTRVQRSTDVTSFWSYNPTDYYKPRHFGHLTGLDLADSQFDRNWEFTPYVSSRMDVNGDVSSLYQSGADLSVRLTPSITSSWTLNPDFGQVEADDDTIELRDTERFLTEKRRFFREGEELLRMRKQLYYSRRFTNIDAGARISGEWRDYKFSLLNIQGDTVHDGVYNGDSTVFRATQNVGERSTLGYYLNMSEFDSGHSRVAGMDGDLFINDDWEYHFQTALADERLEDKTGTVTKDSYDYLGFNSIEYDRYPWRVEVGYDAISKEFNPVLGYTPRQDIFGPSINAGYRHQSDERWYKSVNVNADWRLYENEDGSTILRDYTFNSSVVFPNDFGLQAGQQIDYHAPYDNLRTTAGVSFFNSDFWKRVELNWGGGEFEEVDYNEISIGKNFKPFERWPIRYEFTIRQEDKPTGGADTVWLNRIVFDYYFSDTMWIKSSLQNRDRGVGNISIIYGWEFVHNAHWYLVFNQVSDREETGNSVFTKLTYTF
ncbi:MAG: hypothetical protein GC154_01160 [bacterium]|nr:hypothetical protein [bacterium]